MEYEWLFLAEAFQWSYEQVMAMPCSRRHKAVKFHEEVVRIRKSNSKNGGTPAGATWWQRTQSAKGEGSGLP